MILKYNKSFHSLLLFFLVPSSHSKWQNEWFKKEFSDANFEQDLDKGGTFTIPEYNQTTPNTVIGTFYFDDSADLQKLKIDNCKSDDGNCDGIIDLDAILASGELRVGDFQMDFENANQKKSIEFYILLDVGTSYRNCKRDEAIDYYPCKKITIN